MTDRRGFFSALGGVLFAAPLVAQLGYPAPT